MSSAAIDITRVPSQRMSAVVEQTGISKELVHHYLRQGLLPKSPSRARYTPEQVRLLRLIKTLRDEHRLPLEVIRNLFTIFDFDPGRIEALTLCDSLGKRITDFATQGDVLAAGSLSAPELLAAAGITPERLEACLGAGLVAPSEDQPGPRYSSYDAHVLALCAHGEELGIPFEAFQTIASYVRIAFDLAHGVFYTLPHSLAGAGELHADRILAELFVRRELAGSFVQNLLLALTQRRMLGLLQQTRPLCLPLDEIVFRPSHIFQRHHGLDTAIEQARVQLGARPDAGKWLHIAKLLLHAGRYEEAVFLLTDTAARWPESPALRSALGRAHVLTGDVERGVHELELAAAADDAAAHALLGLTLFGAASRDARPEALIRSFVPTLRHLDRALALSGALPPPEQLEVKMICGWLATALPLVVTPPERGPRLLREVWLALAEAPSCGMPGQLERLRINTAYLIFDSQGRRGRDQATEPADGAPLPSTTDLVATICSIDPASAFAERAFLTSGRQP